MMNPSSRIAFSAVALTALSSLAMADNGNRPMIDWVGNWWSGDNNIIMMLDEDELIIDAFSEHGARDPEKVAQGLVKVGSFFARIPAEGIEDGNRIRFGVENDEQFSYEDADEGICKVDLHLDWPTLTVHDNGRCGGDGVSFTGEYRSPFKGEEAGAKKLINPPR